MAAVKTSDRVLKVLARDYAEAFLRLALPDVPLEIPEERDDA